MNIQIHVDETVGLDTGLEDVRHISNGLGGMCWVATQPVEHIFGTPVESQPLVGIGRTREEALERLAKARRDFAESLWI